MSSLLVFLRRGAAAGAAAGLASGAFSYLLAEPVMDRAVNLESAREAAEQARMAAAGMAVDHHADVFSRSTQHAGLLVATTVTGLALGALFALVYALLHRRDPDRKVWPRSLRLAAAAFTGIWLLPFLRYPANPPGVGDSGTIDLRTGAWLASIGISVIGVVLAWAIHRHLAGRAASAPVRQLAVTGILLAALAVLFALPHNPDAVEVPAKLLWEFRLWSVAAAALLWGGLGTAFGLLGERAVHRAAAAQAAPAPVPVAGALG